jgi:hypothetical protein
MSQAAQTKTVHKFKYLESMLERNYLIKRKKEYAMEEE